MKYFRVVAPDLAIDLGTANTVVARLDHGIVIEEPTVVALDFRKREILAIGEQAKALIGTSPENIAAVRPLQGGAISDFDLTQALLEYYIHRAIRGISIVAPRLTISVPSGATDVESRAVQDACLQAGARDVYLVEETFASAYGADVIQENTKGTMVLSIGAGTTEVAVVSRYGVVTSETLAQGGDSIDRSIAETVRQRYGLELGENTAERLKIVLGSFHDDAQMQTFEVGGRDEATGMPKNIIVFSSDVTAAMHVFIQELVDRIHRTLEKTPPELASDIMRSGLLLTGGGAQMRGLADYLENEIGIPVTVSADPLHDTVHGVMNIMKNIDAMQKRRGRA